MKEKEKQFEETLQAALTRETEVRAESGFRDFDEFQRWMSPDKTRRARTFSLSARPVLAGAAFFCVLLLAGSLLLLPGGLLHAEETTASPGTEQSVQQENGSIVIGGDGNGNVGAHTIVYTSYDELPEKFKREIVWFNEIPEEYELRQITIATNLHDREYYIVYANNTDEMVVTQLTGIEKTDSVSVLNQYDKDYMLDERIVYEKTSDGIRSFSFQEKESFISILVHEEMDVKKIEAMMASIRIGWSKL